VVQNLQPRQRKVRILATLGPASGSPEMIAELHRAGADAFRVNMSHGDHETHAEGIAAIRALEKEFGRPTTILVDLQGPKLRVGTFKGPGELVNGANPSRSTGTRRPATRRASICRIPKCSRR
jgi:pyruvate kinase